MLQTVIDAVVETYADLNTDECCSFGLSANLDGAYQFFGEEACHASLRYVLNDKYDQLITSYPHTDELSAWFFLFMRNVMYRKWAEFIHLEEHEGKLYIRLSDLSKIPANVVYNICICSRTPLEHPSYLRVWGKLVGLGIHPAFAFAVCRAGINEGDEDDDDPDYDEDDPSGLDAVDAPADIPVTVVMYNLEHWPFYNTLNLSSLVSGSPGALSVDYKNWPKGCTPTNSIWGENHQDLKALSGITIREFWLNWKANHEDILQSP